MNGHIMHRFVVRRSSFQLTPANRRHASSGWGEAPLGGGEGYAGLSEIEAMGLRPSADTPDVGIKRADRALAEQLGVDEGTQLISRYQARYINGTPWSLQTSFYPMDLVTQGAHRLLEAEDIREEPSPTSRNS